MSFVGVSGKGTIRNCALYHGITEHTITRQMKKEFDFLELNTEIIKGVPKGQRPIEAQDATHSLNKDVLHINNANVFDKMSKI